MINIMIKMLDVLLLKLLIKRFVEFIVMLVFLGC